MSTIEDLSSCLALISIDDTKQEAKDDTKQEAKEVTSTSPPMNPVNKQRCTTVVKGDALEQKVAEAIRGRLVQRAIAGTVEVIGWLRTWCDLIVTLADGIPRGLQVKTLTTGNGSTKTFMLKKYPPACLLVAASPQWEHFLACSYSVCNNSDSVAINFGQKKRSSSLRQYAGHIFTKDTVDEWLDHVIELLPTTTEVTRENKLEHMSPTCRAEFESIERLAVQLGRVGLTYIPHDTHASVQDGRIEQFGIQLKTTNRIGRNNAFKWIVTSQTFSHTDPVTRKLIHRPYSERDPFDFMIIEAGIDNWFVIPKAALIAEGVLSTDTQPGRITLTVRLPDTRKRAETVYVDEYHSYINAWDQLRGVPVLVVDRCTRVPLTMKEHMDRATVKRRQKLEEARCKATIAAMLDDIITRIEEQCVPNINE